MKTLRVWRISWRKIESRITYVTNRSRPMGLCAR